METEPLNWLAVIVGTVVAFGAGWLWYGKLFRDTWMVGSRLTPADGETMPMFAMLAQVAGLFLLALVIGVTATTSALGTAILAIFATAVLVVSGHAFSRKSMAAMMIDGGYIVVAGALMIVCQGIF